MSDVKNEMIPVPLPTEVPTPPPLDQIPLDILHSATVEMLIQQNEDLSSRLKVNIRRNSQLEQKIMELEKSNLEANRKKENTLAQIEIVKEKEKIWSSQKETKDRKLQALEKESELLELRYNELRATIKQKDKEQQTIVLEKQKTIQKLERKLLILQKVRTKAKDKLRTFLLKIAQTLRTKQKRMAITEASLRNFQKKFIHLQDEFQQKESFFKEQLTQLKDISQKTIQQLSSKIADQEDLITQIQDEKQKYDDDLRQTSHDLMLEKKNRLKLQMSHQEIAELKNQQIKIRRQFDDQQNLSRENLDQLELEVSRLQKKLHLSEKEASEALSQRSICEQKIIELSKDNQNLALQLENTQNLWLDAQTQLEKDELRINALEKINQRLTSGNHEQKVKASIEKAQSAEPTPETELKSAKTPTQPLEKKIQKVFASQYSTIKDRPDFQI